MNKILLSILFFLVCSAAQAATCGVFEVSGGNGNWSSTTNWASTSGGASGHAAPTSSDIVCLDSNSGNIALDGSGNAAAQLLETGGVGATGSYSGQLTFTAGDTLTVSGNVTLSSGATTTGTGTLTFGATSTYTSNGQSFSGSWSIGAFTLTLGDATETLVGTLTTTGSATINSNTLNIGGSLTLGAAITGSSTLVMNGTGTWSGNFGMNSNLTFNTSGTITISGSVQTASTGGVTITYISGTMVTTGSTFSQTNTCTLNTGNMTWNNITISNGSSRTTTLSAALNVSGTLNITSSSTSTLSGNFPITVGTFTAQNFTGIVKFVSGQPLNVTSAINIGGLSNTGTVQSTTASSPFYLNYTGSLANEVLIGATLTDVSASGPPVPFYGRKLLNYTSGGTLTRTQGIVNVNASNINPKFIRSENGAV